MLHKHHLLQKYARPVFGDFLSISTYDSTVHGLGLDWSLQLHQIHPGGPG